MFTNDTYYQEEKNGCIKYSRSTDVFHYRNKTRGLALKYVAKGTEYYDVANRSIELKRGQFVLFPKDENYHSYGNQGVHTDGLCVDINPNLLNIEHTEEVIESFPFYTVYQCNNASAIGRGIMALQNSPLQAQLNGATQIASLAEKLSLFIQEVTRFDRALSASVNKPETRRMLVAKLIDSRDYIYTHFQLVIKLDELAGLAGISKYHFLRLFKQCFGESPRAMQERCRMEQALSLAKTGDLSWTTIAHSLGYSDLAAFSNSFKRYWNQSPSDYQPD